METLAGALVQPWCRGVAEAWALAVAAREGGCEATSPDHRHASVLLVDTQPGRMLSKYITGLQVEGGMRHAAGDCHRDVCSARV